jgi:hypothetical protein
MLGWERVMGGSRQAAGGHALATEAVQYGSCTTHTACMRHAMQQLATVGAPTSKEV